MNTDNLAFICRYLEPKDIYKVIQVNPLIIGIVDLDLIVERKYSIDTTNELFLSVYNFARRLRSEQNVLLDLFSWLLYNKERYYCFDRFRDTKYLFRQTFTDDHGSVVYQSCCLRIIVYRNVDGFPKCVVVNDFDKDIHLFVEYELLMYRLHSNMKLKKSASIIELSVLNEDIDTIINFVDSLL